MKEGKKHGKGTFTFSNGEKFVGEWGGENYNGHGTYTFPDGERYEGDFKEGQYHGQGILTLPDGGELVGEFRDQEPWNVTEYDKEGNITERWVNGVEQE